MIYNLEEGLFDTFVWKGMELSSINELYTYLHDSDYRIRTIAAKIIQAKYPTKDSYEKALGLIKSNQANEREIGAYVLGQLGTPIMPFALETYPLLEELLEDEDIEVLVTSISSIGHLATYQKPENSNTIASKLIKLANHKNADVRSSVAMALASLQTTDEIRDTIKVLEADQDIEVIEWAKIAQEIIDEEYGTEIRNS
ncbi:MAG: HEAT repeat domain-containing protein [Campylobacterota bacterium]